MNPPLRIAVICATLAATAATSRADWSYGNLPNPYATQLYYDAFGHGRRSAADDSAGTAATAEPAHRSPKATDFKRANGRPVLEEFLASTGLAGDQADELRGVMEAQIAELEASVRKNNVAAAMGVLFAISYRVVNNIEIDDASRDRVIAYVNDALAVQHSFQVLQAKGRQDAADTALVQAALIAVMSAQDDADAQAVALEGARAALLQLTGSETGGVESNLTLNYGDVID